MGRRYGDIAFTDDVKAVQTAMGSRAVYARREDGAEVDIRLGPAEAAFIAARDGFYIASVSETGWPYIQFRGGPAGFLRVLDDATLGFADFRGNRQYITTGNLKAEERVSLFLMDYGHRRRLKLFGTMRASDDPALVARLAVEGYPAHVERGMLIHVEAFDWNCPQHITPRFTPDEFAAVLAEMHASEVDAAT